MQDAIFATMERHGLTYEQAVSALLLWLLMWDEVTL